MNGWFYNLDMTSSVFTAFKQAVLVLSECNLYDISLQNALFLIQLNFSEPPEALSTHTFCKFRYLIHVIYPTNLYSSQEPVKH